MSHPLNLRSRKSTSAPPGADDERASDSEAPRRLEVLPELSPSSSLSQRALENTAHLANLLPTGTLLAFQLLTPIFTHNGSCDAATRPLTLILLSTLALSCFLASFTDSERAPGRRVYYGFATPRGMRLFDSPAAGAAGITSKDLEKYKVGLVDYVHAALSVLVFAATALRDQNVVDCLYPKADRETREALDIVPIGIGLLSSLLFIAFPTRRHGIGFPVTSGGVPENNY